MIDRDLPAGPGLVARARFTDRADGDFRIDGAGEALAASRRAVVAHPWSWLRQVHGADVVVVDRPGAGAGREADASVTSVPGAVLCVQTADCAPVVLVGEGMVGVVHVGWRGLVAGVVRAAVEAVRRGSGSGPVHAVLGPCIHPAGYEFGAAELARVVAVAGPAARGRTERGAPALDLPAAVGAVLGAAGVDRVEDLGLDTRHPRFWSHRARGDLGRQASVVWLEEIR